MRGGRALAQVLRADQIAPAAPPRRKDLVSMRLTRTALALSTALLVPAALIAAAAPATAQPLQEALAAA